jgi:hypothetical protein
MIKHVVLVALLALVAIGSTGAGQPAPDRIAAGKRGFLEVYKVLQSPRCLNCHPSGDRPLQGDRNKPHAQNVSRGTVAAGVPCTTCHQARNSEYVGVPGGPPGAPKWGLPPAATPMVFQGKTATQICEQMRDPAQNNGKSLAQLLEHAASDPIVLWGWAPGGQRTLPPLSHEAFAAAFKAWVEADAACP